MKSRILLVCVALFASGSAVAAVSSGDCAAKSKQVKLVERNAFIKSCMAQMNATASKENEQRNKRATCEQNAKNQGLDGAAKSSYVSECLNNNQAATAVVEVKRNQSLSNKERFNKNFSKEGFKNPLKENFSTSKHRHAKVARNSSNTKESCSRQASKKRLKGSAYRKFMTSCQKD